MVVFIFFGASFGLACLTVLPLQISGIVAVLVGMLSAVFMTPLLDGVEKEGAVGQQKSMEANNSVLGKEGEQTPEQVAYLYQTTGSTY